MKTLEKIFSIFLALQLCFTALPIQTFAETAEESNIEQSTEVKEDEIATEAPVVDETEALKENSADKPSDDKQQRDTESFSKEDVIAESSDEVQKNERNDRSTARAPAAKSRSSPAGSGKDGDRSTAADSAGGC